MELNEFPREADSAIWIREKIRKGKMNSLVQKEAWSHQKQNGEYSTICTERKTSPKDFEQESHRPRLRNQTKEKQKADETNKNCSTGRRRENIR